MIAEMFVDKINEIEERHPLVAGVLSGAIDGCILVGSTFATLGVIEIIKRKLL